MRSTAVSLISSVFSVSVASLFCESAGANCNLTRLLDKLNSAKVSGASAAASTSSAAADFSGPEKRAIVSYWKSHSKLLAGLCLLAGLLTAGTVAARDHEDALALGDSVVFGFITQAGFEYVNPDNFIGYPEYLNVFDDLDFANAACPGETTGSFLSSTAPDNGCRYFRSLAPLHVAYGSTQFNFAKDFLSQHRQVRLVTIGLGANDLTLLENSCAGAANPTQCYKLGLPGVLQTIAANMATILADLRATGFGGVIVIVNYYSLDYSDPVGTAVTGYLNEAISTPASAYGAVIADVFSAFQKVASTPPAGGKTCAAGLLNASPEDQFLCDVHPSQSGQRLIARTVARAIAAGHD